MKTYKEYYQLAKEGHLSWLDSQKEKWWTMGDLKELHTQGDYIETVKFLTLNEKNDASLFTNHTNVRNSEWSILFHMLGQALVDWMNENGKGNNLWSFGFEMNRVVDGTTDVYHCPFYVKAVVPTTYDYEEDIKKIEDEKELDEYSGCRDFLCDLVDRFISDHKVNLPLDWNYFSFGLDSLYSSCEYGMWVCASDGYLNFGNLQDWKRRDGYSEYVMSM